ncbi:MAG: AMP nucleosidase [Rhodospirillales bacterium]|nr:AMP nucleosidase [Rhodospirillales bacterium]
MAPPPDHIITDAQSFDNPEAAVDRLCQIYNAGKSLLADHFQKYAAGEPNIDKPDARYPYIWIDIPTAGRRDGRMLSYGTAAEIGAYGTTITHPELFRDYLVEQLELLIANHNVPVWVGISNRQIPLTFALETMTVNLSQQQIRDLTLNFHLPNLSDIDDNVANGLHYTHPGDPKPLSLFSAERVDYSLSRLRHYSGTSPEHFQQFVLFTNYQRYVDEFIQYGLSEISDGTSFQAFVRPGDEILCNAKLTDRPSSGEAAVKLPQMPAYHLVRDGHMGVTLVNIGVGPSNAKTITDHIAVLRPHCWVMVGHCGGLRHTQRLGDYVLAHAYARLDHVLDNDLPLEIPIPAIAEVQVALTNAVENATGLSGREMKQRIRTGTVVTTDDRDWELRYDELSTFFNQSRAIAVDMESATIAANGFRLRVPYGTLLCVSDKPMHGEIKLPGMANAFYEERVSQHLKICLDAIEAMREGVAHQSLHSRKLRSFDEPAFR